MKNSLHLIIFLALAAGMAGCAENQMPEHEITPALYFARSANVGEQCDSISHSFFVLQTQITQDTAWVQINTMGELSSEDRPITLRQTNAGQPDAAIAGQHYLPFDAPGIYEKMRIPAKKATVKVPIVFLRHNDLDFMKVRLHLTIAGNDYFRPGIDSLRNFVLTTTAQAVKPSIWDRLWSGYFGPTFGTEKFRFIIDATGYTDWEVFPIDYFYTEYLRNTTLQKFEQWNINHPGDPLTEADGSPVVFL